MSPSFGRRRTDLRKYLMLVLVGWMLSSLIVIISGEAKELAEDPDKVTREANGLLTYYGDLVYYWGRNEAEKGTEVTNAFFREKLDGSEKMMLSDWNEKVGRPEFDIENESIYYLGYDYRDNNWRYFLKKMDLDGKNKEVVYEPLSFGEFEVEGKWLYFIDYDIKNCPSDLEDNRPGVIKRTNLETKETVVLKKCIYPRLWPITEKGIYIEDEFYPTGSTKAQKSGLKDVWKQIGHPSADQLEVVRDSVFPDRGNIYYLLWSQLELRSYFVQYNENSRKTTLLKKIPTDEEGPYLRLVNVHRGYAYFEASPYKGHGRELHRIPLTGGDLKKVIDIPKQMSYSFINGHIYFWDEDYDVVDRVPLPR